MAECHRPPANKLPGDEPWDDRRVQSALCTGLCAAVHTPDMVPGIVPRFRVHRRHWSGETTSKRHVWQGVRVQHRLDDTLCC